jgi:hypothetical protein
MLVINRTEFPVAIPYKDGRIIIPADRNPHNIPDDFYKQYEEFLFCARPPVPPPKPIVPKVEKPALPLDNTAIDLNLLVSKEDQEKELHVNNIKQNISHTLKIKKSTKGRKRDWGPGKKSQNKIATGKALFYDPIQTSGSDIVIPAKTEEIGNTVEMKKDENIQMQYNSVGQGMEETVKNEFYEKAEETTLFKDVTKEMTKKMNEEENREVKKI